MLLGIDVFDYIAYETNVYARQKGDDDLSITPSEMAAFIGMNIAMGIINLPKVHDYWSTDPILHHP